MNKRLKPLLPGLILFMGVGLALGSAFSIYHNLKKDNVDGRGNLYVTEDCDRVGPWDYDYLCRGTYQQDSGMISIPDATVHVSDWYRKGDRIGDIYRVLGISYETPASAQHFIAGDERRGLLHNLPAALGVMVGLELAVASVGFWFIRHRRH